MTRIQADIVERSAEIVNLNVDEEGAISGNACFDVKKCSMDERTARWWNK